MTQVRPLLPGSETCRVLVTSRSRLSGLVARDGAHRVSVTTLAQAEAVDLLCKTTSEYRQGDSDEELSELARLCAYLPLALRIAAERAAAIAMCVAIDNRLARRFSESRLHYHAASELFTLTGDRLGLLLAENGLGLVELWAHNMDASVAHLSNALHVAKELGDGALAGVILSSLGEAWLEFGEPDRAVALLEESIGVLRDGGDRIYELDAMSFLGRALCRQGRLPEARAMLEAALAGMHEIALTANSEGHINLDFARLQLAEGSPGDALVSSQRAASAFRELGNAHSEAMAWALSGQSFLRLQRWNEAAAFLKRAVAGHREAGSPWQVANDLHDLAAALSRLGEHERARDCLSEAFEVLAGFTDPSADALRARISAELA